MVMTSRNRFNVSDTVEKLISNGFTPEDIGSKLHVSASTVRSWLRDDRRPGWLVAQKLEHLLRASDK